MTFPEHVNPEDRDAWLRGQVWAAFLASGLSPQQASYLADRIADDIAADVAARRESRPIDLEVLLRDMPEDYGELAEASRP